MGEDCMKIWIKTLHSIAFSSLSLSQDLLDEKGRDVCIMKLFSEMNFGMASAMFDDQSLCFFDLSHLRA